MGLALPSLQTRGHLADKIDGHASAGARKRMTGIRGMAFVDPDRLRETGEAHAHGALICGVSAPAAKRLLAPQIREGQASTDGALTGVFGRAMPTDDEREHRHVKGDLP